MRPRQALVTLVVVMLTATACRGGGTRMADPSATTIPPLTGTPGVLVVGASDSHPRLRWEAPGAPAAGFDADIVAEIADRLGLGVRWVAGDAVTLQGGLADRSIDLVVTTDPLADAEPDQEHTDPYYQEPASGDRVGFLVSAGSSELRTRVDVALGSMVLDGTYQTIYDSWFDIPDGSILFVPPAAAIGERGRPIRLVFVPMVHPVDIRESARRLVDELEDRTDLFFEVSVADSYAGAVSAMCDLPEETVGFLSAHAFVVAADLCEAHPTLVAVRLGSTVTWAEFLVPRDSGPVALSDLDGLVWAHPGDGSLPGTLIPQAMMTLAGVTPGREIVVDNHAEAVRAVYLGLADFATVFFRPAVDASGVVLWDGTPENADVPDDLLWSCSTISTGELVCLDGLRPRDARVAMREQARDIIQQVRILTTSEAIPNDVVAFGSGFPGDLRALLTAAILDLATDDPDRFAQAFQPYAWHGVAAIDDSDFESLRRLLAALGFGLDDL